MNEELYNYLKKEFQSNNIPKYWKYFNDWIQNLTENQIYYYKELWYKS